MLADKIIDLIELRPGISDRCLSETIFGTPHRRTQINGECRYLALIGRIQRRKTGYEPIGNFPVRAPQSLTSCTGALVSFPLSFRIGVGHGDK